jgi:signal transduction histidine kinase
VLNNILDFSKLEAGHMNPESIDFSIKHSINSVISLMGSRAAGRGLILRATLAPDLPIWLRGDPSRIGQVLLNPVGNAIKFTEHGFVQISVSHRTVQDSAIELCFDVVDTGAGIPTSVLPTLFSPFTQADSSVSRKYGGTGLGLAICKQLCLTMGGDIDVESAFGKGSRFRFTVLCQLGQPPEVAAPQLQPAIARRPRMSASSSPRTIRSSARWSPNCWRGEDTRQIRSTMERKPSKRFRLSVTASC